jgi:hypothetical protein
MSMKHLVILLGSSLSLAVLAASATNPAKELSAQIEENDAAVLFDDFTYEDRDALSDNGWIVRTEPGWPGVPGAIWWEDGVAVLDDPENLDNRLVQMTSATDGTTTYQTQLCHQRKFYEGTYASRVRFSDEPASGPDGDQIVQTFYTISPLAFALDPDYSELDFEYLPNGGWGMPRNVFFVTTWETFRPEPDWQADNTSDWAEDSYDSWHTLVIQATDGTVGYYIDDDLMGTHRGRYYPEVPMSINYNLWFIRDGQIRSNEAREYIEQIDWVFHVANTILSPDEVAEAVDEYRTAEVDFVDTVPEWSPPMPSPCNF